MSIYSPIKIEDREMLEDSNFNRVTLENYDVNSDIEKNDVFKFEHNSVMIKQHQD